MYIMYGVKLFNDLYFAKSRWLYNKVELIMNIKPVEIFQGNKIEILEIFLKKVNYQLELSWKINFENVIYRLAFHNVSRFTLEKLSIPMEVQGLEVINHAQDGWEKDLTYEVRDFEDNRVSFFCEYFEVRK